MLAKLVAPSCEGVYLRQGLLSRLDQVSKTKIVWINAAGGSGKSTLVASYLAQQQRPHIWYQLDEGDNDPATFFYYLGQAVAASAPDSAALPLLTPEYLPGLAAFSRKYFRELAQRITHPFALVFDNYQVIQPDAALHEIISVAAAELPDRFTLFVTSRTAPPESYARLHINRMMSVIDGDVLLLSEQETREMCCNLDKHVSDDVVAAIHARTRGWIAGILLLMQRPHGLDRLATNGAFTSNSSVLFGYFSTEIFSQLSPEARAMSLLLALMPRFTHEMLLELFANENGASGLLEQILFNQFILTHDAELKTYQLHPLYREFLLSKARQEFSVADYQKNLQRLGQLLIKNNRIDDAFELLRELKDPAALVGLILSYAGELVSQGRYHTLRTWLAVLDSQMINANAWLCYWSAVSEIPLSLLAARQRFEQAFTHFRREKDQLGSLLAWAGVVQTYHFLWDSFAPLDRWIELLDELLPSDFEELDMLLQWQVVTGMFSSLVIRQPGHPDIAVWRQRAERLVFHPGDVNQQLAMASKIMLFYLWQGDMEQARHLAERITPRSGQASPFYTLYWWHIEIAYRWFRAEFAQAMQLVDNTMKLIEDNGILGYHCLTMGQAAYTLLSKNAAHEATPYLERMQASIIPGNVLHQSHYYYLVAYHSMLMNDLQAAHKQITIGVEIAKECGAVLAYVMAELALASVECERRHFAEALSILDRMDPIIVDVNSKMLVFRSGVVRADILLRQDNEAAAIKIVRDCFAVGAADGMVNFDWWFDGVMARLCALALRNDIQKEYVCKLIRLRNLSPAKPSVEFEAWPWEVCIYTLGRFAVTKDGVPITFSGKAQKKTLGIVKALLSLGGRDVSESRLQDALWPDAEGDQAKQNLKATVYRVRKLIGAESIQWHEGKLSLNPQLCWADVWAFEQQLNKLLQVLPTGDAEIMSAMNDILNRYPGPYLQGDDDSYLLGMRERLRSKVLRLLEQAARALGQQHHAGAISLYLRALEIEPLAEVFYQGLMRSYLALGLMAEAQSAYERCRNNLMALLKLSPSPETERLASTIK